MRNFQIKNAVFESCLDVFDIDLIGNPHPAFLLAKETALLVLGFRLNEEDAFVDTEPDLVLVIAR